MILNILIKFNECNKGVTFRVLFIVYISIKEVGIPNDIKDST